ncbi:MAG: HD domain-containing protein [Deltaproteobacteria bacterium]|nr:HD domain-containing protein [Deltaproteobacteria bacterium]
MLRFSDLDKKGVKKEAETDSSVIDDLSPEEGVQLDAKDWYQRACRFMGDVFLKVRDQQKPNLTEGESLIQDIVQASLRGNLPQDLLIRAQYGNETSSFLVNKAVNVTVFAIFMGDTLGLPKERLLQLGLAALLHDIGKALVPEEILYKEGTLNKDELEVLQKYPYDSFNILQGLGDKYHYLAECALHVNERLDGSGFPQGLEGDAINPYAKIIGILELYEAMTHNRPQRQKLSHFEAVKEIIKTKKSAFQRELLKAFLNTFGIFPLHCLVKLNSGAVGRVIQTYEEQPLRPKIEIIVDAQNKRVKIPRTVDLREQQVLYIADALTEANLNG